MSSLFGDRVKETTITTGAGALALLGAVAQYVSCNTFFGVGPRFKYTIEGQTGTEWEVGEGYLSGTTTLVRDIIYASSNAGVVVTLSAGTKNVFCSLPVQAMLSKSQHQTEYAHTS